MNSELLKVGFSLFGLKEALGAKDNPEIIAMAKYCGFNGYAHDSIAWCALAQNYVNKKAGFEASGKLNAKSFKSIGETVEFKIDGKYDFSNVQPGDICVFWRNNPNGWEGHVAMFINYRQTEGRVYVLGGNQGDAYNVSAYPVERLEAIRRPRKIEGK
jgi:uncharacterized protein (TIGR02594 family)